MDYMAEHLMPSGRAGIIVPEGIIFQSQTAYKQLRKVLVDEYLSRRCFSAGRRVQPLFWRQDVDSHSRQVAGKEGRPHVAFFKIDNDGFDLGAQRRPIGKNDLHQAQAEIAEYLRRLRAGETRWTTLSRRLGLIVEEGED